MQEKLLQARGDVIIQLDSVISDRTLAGQRFIALCKVIVHALWCYYLYVTTKEIN